MKKAILAASLFLLLVLLMTFTSCPASSGDEQEALTAKVDELFAKWDKWDSPGAALAVVKDGEIIYKRGYGSAQLEYNIPITPSTIFHVASVSKQFTAFAINLLADEGKLSLDDDIRKHLPELNDFGEKITIRHLIHHTSGLRDQWELLAMAGWRLDDVITKEHIMKIIRNQRELNFEPGDEYLYCNSGYTLMAEIVERASGQTFREFTQERIFKPLGMSNTHFHDDHEMIVKNRAYSYAPQENGGFRNSVLSYANVGATSLFTTVEDLAKWIANFEDGRVGGATLVERMKQRFTLNSGNEIPYARGLVIDEYRGLKTVGHSGGDAGFRSHLVHFPEQRFGVVILSNLSNLGPGQLAYRVADIYLADQLEPQESESEEKRPPAVEVDTEILDACVGRYELIIGLVLDITREDDKLFAQPIGQGKSKLIPVSETTFYSETTGAKIIFYRNDDGVADRISIHPGGQDIPGQRIEVWSPDAAQRAELAGEYYSEELGTSYMLVVRDDRLVATHRRHADIELTPVKQDQLAGNRWWFGRARIVRDDDGRVTGFRLTGGRVRNLRFEKTGQR